MNSTWTKENTKCRETILKDYPKGNQDENYYSEIWIPVKAK